MAHSISYHNLDLAFTGNKISFTLHGNKADSESVCLAGSLGDNLPIKQVKQKITEDGLFVDFHNCTLHIQHSPITQQKSRFAGEFCVNWRVKTGGTQCTHFLDRIALGEMHWYGVAQVRKQLWPIEKWDRKLEPFVAGDSYADELGGVQDRYWLCSGGFAVVVDKDCPLFVAHNDKNDGNLTFCSACIGPYRRVNKRPFMAYSLFYAEDIRQVHELARSGARPLGVPDVEIIRSPIWTTWARYKKDITQDTVIEFAKEVKEHGFRAAQIEIDDDWTPHYGDMTFDTTKFPDPKAMVSKLSELGFRVTLWVHPFCDFDSHACNEPSWVQGESGGATVWWNGLGKCLDVTNQKAVENFKSKLTHLQDAYGITSFKFDAGEINWLPVRLSTQGNLTTPNDYPTRWAELAYDVDQDVRCQEVRVGVNSQKLPIFVRMMDKDSNWTCDNGLRTMIPHCLTFGLLGYSFVLPDMIGGNAYSGEFPDRELFIRWLQVNVFMPAVQFSVCPWQYDEEVVKISKKMLELRDKYTDKIIQLAKDTTRTGFPINRPLWWMAPKDQVAQVVDSEFLLGDDVLVAPVLDKGAKSRDVYFPDGVWRDGNTGAILQGGRWHRDHPAPLDVLPYFVLISDSQGDLLTDSAEEQKAPSAAAAEPLLELIKSKKNMEKEQLAEELNALLKIE